jgi:hypothetical protein
MCAIKILICSINKQICTIKIGIRWTNRIICANKELMGANAIQNVYN